MVCATMVFDKHKPYTQEGKDMGHGDIAENKVRISLVLPKILKEDLKLMADYDKRSANNLIVKILEDYRDTYGINYDLPRKRH